MEYDYKVPKIIIICGEKGQGKTTFVHELVCDLKKRNVKVGGILAQGFWKEDVRDKYELLDLQMNQRITYCQRSAQLNWQQIRHFFINPEGQKFGDNALDSNNVKDLDAVVVDELGPFELARSGWYDSVKVLMNKSELTKIFVVRKGLLEEIIALFGMTDYALFFVDENHINDVIHLISKRK